MYPNVPKTVVMLQLLMKMITLSYTTHKKELNNKFNLHLHVEPVVSYDPFSFRVMLITYSFDDASDE